MIHEPDKGIRDSTVSAMANLHLVCNILMLSLILLSSIIPNSNSQNTIREAEKTALLNIERDWGKPMALNWSFIRHTDQCNWPGINCTGGFVTSISLVGCDLNKPIPQEICSFNNLMYIDLSHNHITGPFPATLFNCSKLQHLDLSHNVITGSFPTTLFNCSRLQHLDLSHNVIAGSFPTTLFNCSRLQHLDLSHNVFNGFIPSNIHEFLLNLEYLNLASNHLFGNIPSTISQLDVSFLYLDDNMLSGLLPSRIFFMPYLKELNLRKNNLSGEIPDIFWWTMMAFRQINTIDLSENNLSGPIPETFAYLEPAFLNLSSNQLTGQIPSMLMINRYEQSFQSNPGLCSFDHFGHLPMCIRQSEEDREVQKRSLIIIMILGSITLVCTGLFGFLKLRTFLIRQKHSEPAPAPLWKLTTFHPVNFNVQDILCGLTNNNLVGSGGSGMVYKIYLNNSNCQVIAVKKISNGQTKDHMLEKQFEAEIGTLGSIRHANIIKLLGCISSSESKLLIYEYMEHGSLYDLLHHKDLTSTMEEFSWPMRMSIAVDAARGMCYMHHDCSPPIAHRDVKSSNILLDLEFKAKIADFGLARVLAKVGEPESVSVMVGSFGYIAPEFGSIRKINEKVDVYSFGVVLLELTTGKRATGDGGGHENLAQWAWRKFQETNFQLTDVIDENIRHASNLREVELVFKLGLICTGTEPSSRPSMKEVLQVLQR